MVLFLFFFFFFKQKTAYEMCGRDWSSDVCSSDLNIYLVITSNHLPYNEINICNAIVKPVKLLIRRKISIHALFSRDHLPSQMQELSRS